MQDLSKIKIIIGLGNPGPEYENNYHNLGFLALDELAQGLVFKKYKHFNYAKSSDYIFIKPETFMNESGLAIKEALDFFSLKPENIIIIQDDSDIELGKAKISFGQNSGGHRGIESAIQHLKTKDFWRFKIGARKNFDSETRVKAIDFVLKNMSPEDKKTAYSLIGLLREKLRPKTTPPVGEEIILDNGKEIF